MNNKVIVKEYVEKNYVSKKLIRDKYEQLFYELGQSENLINDKIIINQLLMLKDILEEGETNDGDKTR